MSAMASQITCLIIVYSTVFLGADEGHKGPVTRQMFPFDDVTMLLDWIILNESCTGHCIVLESTCKTMKSIKKTLNFRLQNCGHVVWASLCWAERGYCLSLFDVTMTCWWWRQIGNNSLFWLLIGTPHWQGNPLHLIWLAVTYNSHVKRPPDKTTH